MAFTSLPWKEQRAILMEFVLEASDAELARGFGGYDEILDELAKAPSTDDILKKYASQLKALKQEQTELPVRIDEAMQSKVDVDAVNIAAHKKALLGTIDEYEQKMASYAGRANEMKGLVADKANCESEIQRLTAKYERDAYEVRHNLEKKVSDTEVKIDLAKRRKDAAEREVITLKANADGIVNVNKKLSEKLGIPGRCPTCGQALDDEAIKRRDESVSDRIKQNEDEIHSIGVKVMDAENRAAEADEEIKTASEVIEEIKAGMSTIPTAADVIKQDAQYIMLNKQLADVLDRMTALNKTDYGQYDRLRMLVDGLRKEVANLDAEYAKSLRNDEIDVRIENLRQEQMDVGDKIIHIEHLRDLTEAFMKQKMDTVSETINDQFDGVKFKLFDIQLNGGIAPTCECTVNGVPFASLNNGARIVSGLKIIRTLQRHYGVSLPVFVDNAEAISDGFMPEMDGQMILLEVTNDKELVVR
jgi:chromosome segregation ATPase